MKKKTLIAAAAVLVLSLGVALGVKKTNMDHSPWTENIEALCDSEGPTYCLATGDGHSCSVELWGLGVSCSVTCHTGFACCTTYGCFCI